MAISSNKSVAGGISASFSQSASALNSISVSMTASSTNVAGNIPAMESINAFQQDLKSLSNSIVSAGNTIHSIAKEFDKVDQHIAQSTKFNL
jgi:type VII secretion effector (TIGR04197 family)